MKRLAAGLALLAVAACGEGGDPVQMALRDAAAARQAATVQEGVTAPPVTAAAEPGSTGDAAFVAGMIEHHQAAVALATKTLKSSDDPAIRRMAEAEIETRTREIADLQAWTPSPPSPAAR
ncbi:MAG: DUF305 domain-containing protein [Brevundimonas sp.]|nr:DUF305 domain-containing protein [Brevundimonas sp.]